MKLVISFFIFCIVLFIYLHVQFQLKTGEDLEVYELEDASKDKLEEICDLRQPVLFDFYNQKIVESCNISTLLSNYHAFEIKVRNVNDKDCSYLPVQLSDATKLFQEDSTGMYFSESNEDFLNETGSVKSIQYNDEYLRPYMVSNCKYDVMFGSEKVKTPFRYELNYRNYFTVSQGGVKIKLSPPKSGKYLEPISDYENFEFRSVINPWVIDPQAKYKSLEVYLPLGKTIYIPAYWWYSIEFEKNSSIVCCRYRTFMNNIAIVPNAIMYALQNQNIKLDIILKKEMPVNETQKQTSNTVSIEETKAISVTDSKNNSKNEKKKGK